MRGREARPPGRRAPVSRAERLGPQEQEGSRELGARWAVLAAPASEPRDRRVELAAIAARELGDRRVVPAVVAATLVPEVRPGWPEPRPEEPADRSEGPAVR